MADLFEKLVQLRYPEVAKIHPKDFGPAILTGKNRVSLLSWLIVSSCQTVAPILLKLEGSALEDELVKYYSQLGICNGKNSLLGNGTPKDELATLKLLLLFVNNVRIKNTAEVSNGIRESDVSEILRKHINETVDVIPSDCSIRSRLNRSEANAYIREVEKNLDKIKERANKCEDSITQINPCKEQTVGSSREGCNGGERGSSQAAVLEKFKGAFESVTSWRTLKSTNSTALASDTLDEDTREVYSEFCVLNKAIQAKKALANFTIPQNSKKLETPLGQVIEDAVIRLEEVCRLNNSGSSD